MLEKTTCYIILLVACGLAAGDWIIQLSPGTDAKEFARTHHLRYVGPLDFLPAEDNFHKFVRGRGRVTTTTRDLQKIPRVLSVEEQVVRPRKFTRSNEIADPMYPTQWHLHNNAFGVDIEYSGANRTGKGVTIAVVDDGLQWTHPDLKENYAAPHSYDFNGHDADPMPGNDGDGHGTSAAGVAAAVRRNGHCGQGVAPRATIAGVRVIAAPVTDEIEARALSFHAVNGVDIYSCSWGPEDNGITMERPGALAERVLSLYAGGGRGRLGKGSIYVWAAGNGREQGDSCAYDGYATSPYVMAIGAIDHSGGQAWYSEGCAALMAVTPSSGGGQGIGTVDLMGPAGYDGGECTARFGGTSAAAPLMAGLVALMLEERPDLTWRDVKHIVARAAQPIHTEDPDWSHNAAGYRHSHKYGFGLLKIPTLLSVTRDHALVPSPHRIWESGVQTLIDPHGWIPCSINVTVRGSHLTHIEHVVLEASVSHISRGSVVIKLTSPEGITSTLAPGRVNDRSRNYPAGGWPFTSVRHWGETHADGVWRIDLLDTNPRTSGHNHFNGYQLRIFGY